MPAFRRPYLTYSIASKLVKLRALENRNTILAVSVAVWITLGGLSAWLAADTAAVGSPFPFAVVYLAAWAVPAALITMHILLVRRLRARLIADEFMVCRRCRYATGGLGARGACPECGRRFDRDRQEVVWRAVTYAHKEGQPLGFAVRQFTGKPTVRQYVFDATFGLLLPIICVIFDPLVFSGITSLRGVRDAVYFGIVAALAIFLLWLVFGARTRMLSAMLGSAMLVSAVAALLIGIAIFPLSVLGIMFFIGVLGFTPFFTAFAFLRNGVRAMAVGRSGDRTTRVISMIAGGGLIAVALTAGHWIQYRGDPSAMIGAIIGILRQILS